MMTFFAMAWLSVAPVLGILDLAQRSSISPTANINLAVSVTGLGLKSESGRFLHNGKM
jgi:hypothetical protein